MAELLIYTENIKENIKKLSQLFNRYNIEWSLITKVFSGDKAFLNQIFTSEIINLVNSIGDSRLTSLKNLKEVNKNMRTIYIKPPAKIYADEVVRYADISLNTSLSTINALNEAAIRQNKIHEVIIMIELGELREGVQRSEILSFYQKVFDLSNIDVIGIGSNLGCMYGIAPTYDKLLQLSLYKELIAARFKKDLRLVSGGSSITLPLLVNSQTPKEINHYRIGEAVFFGKSPLDDQPFLDLATKTFEFTANIIELEEKKIVPEGIISDAGVGHAAAFSEQQRGETSMKAILDFGLLDVDQENIEAMHDDLTFVGITSDMMVVDLGNNLDEQGNQKYKIGDKIKFIPNYMAVARLLNSKFIDKEFV